MPDQPLEFSGHYGTERDNLLDSERFLICLKGVKLKATITDPETVQSILAASNIQITIEPIPEPAEPNYPRLTQFGIIMERLDQIEAQLAALSLKDEDSQGDVTCS